jgi:hypothetical protein
MMASMSGTAARRRARLRASVIRGLLAVILAAAGFFTLWYRSYYNIWPGQDATARVHWCERDYQNDGGPPETWRQVTAESRFPVTDFGRYPPLGVPGQQLFAAILPDAPPSSCTTVIYLRTGPDSYQSYSLLGGP